MLLLSLLLTPIVGALAILLAKENGISLQNLKRIALTTSTVNFFISLVIFILFDFSTNQFQFVQEYHQISYFDFYLGVDGLSIYFILLTTLIIPISLVSNWKSITNEIESYIILILLLETLVLVVFLVLEILSVFLVLEILFFYTIFVSILPLLFILVIYWLNTVNGTFLRFKMGSYFKIGIYFSSEVVCPHSFAYNPLNSDMSISEIVTEVSTLLPQLENFINQFNTTVTQSGVNVITDSIGSMSIEVPHTMTDEAANKIGSRIGIIDRLITTRGQEINELLQKGIQIENKLKLDDPNYVSQLTEKVKEFKRLNSSYKH